MRNLLLPLVLLCPMQNYAMHGCASLITLPHEIQKKIIVMLADPTDFPDSIKSIKNLCISNKTYASKLSDPDLNGLIVQQLSALSKEKEHIILNGFFLKTVGAYAWLKRQLLVDSDLRAEAECMFFRCPIYKEKFLRIGVGANIKTLTGIPALIHALKKQGGHIFIKALINNGANANTMYNGESALIYAIRDSRILHVVQTLVVAGADLRATSNDGLSALQLAQQLKLTDIVQFLKEKGAV